MQVGELDKAHQARNSEEEVEVLDALSILGFISVIDSKARSLENGDVLSVKDHGVSQN